MKMDQKSLSEEKNADTKSASNQRGKVLTEDSRALLHLRWATSWLLLKRQQKEMAVRALM